MMGQRKGAPPAEGGVVVSGKAAEPEVPQGPEGEPVICPECSCEFIPEPAGEAPEGAESSELAAQLAEQFGA